MTETHIEATTPSGKLRFAADIGGTFTDVVIHDLQGGEHRVAKSPTTPEDLSKGVLAALDRLINDFGSIVFAVHGTTQGINTFIERSGDRVMLLTTAGARDIYHVLRGARPREQMYNNRYRRPGRLVTRRDTLEIGGRLDYAGNEIAPLSEADLRVATDYARTQRIQSIAICFLFSFLNPAHELRARELIRERLPDCTISLSHEVAREWRESERASTTVMDAYIGRVVRSYLERLEAEMNRRHMSVPLHVMRSSGGLMTAAAASDQPVQTLFSGPVGGTMGCVALATGTLGRPNLLCADVGGTSFDVSLVIDGRPTVVNETLLEGLDMILPLVEIHSIGAGGGSLAYVEGGGLRVGPQSAGASPGPACYGRGGVEPTVTDAHVHLGRFRPRRPLGGGLVIDSTSAERSLAGLAHNLSMDITQLAEGILDVANAKMADAIKRITVDRGIEPKDFVIVAFGGAGPLHAPFLARELEIAEVLVPSLPGVFSAWGMLQAPVRHDESLPFYYRLDSLPMRELEAAFAAVEERSAAFMRNEGVTRSLVVFQRFADMRYDGQEYTVTVELAQVEYNREMVAAAFHEAYRQRYGHAHEDAAIELVALRVASLSELLDRETEFPVRQESDLLPEDFRPVIFGSREHTTRIMDGGALEVGQSIEGPAIVEGATTTTVVPPGARLEVGAGGILVMHV